MSMTQAELETWTYDKQAKEIRKNSFPILGWTTLIIAIVAGVVFMVVKELQGATLQYAIPSFLTTVVAFLLFFFYVIRWNNTPAVCTECRKPMKRIEVDFLNAKTKMPDHFRRHGKHAYETADGRTYVYFKSSGDNGKDGTFLIRQEWFACKRCKRAFILNKIKSASFPAGQGSFLDGQMAAEARARSFTARQRLLKKRKEKNQK